MRKSPAGGPKRKKTVDNCAYCVYTVNIRYIQFDEDEKMEIYISNTAGEPIYEQIRKQIQQKILAGELREGDALPSIRLLAKELRISVITTKRAYEELEAEGYICTMQGKGSFVAPRNPELYREETLKKVESLLAQALEAAAAGGVAPGEVRQMLALLMEEE